MATVLQSSRLEAPAAVVWDRLQRPDLLREVTRPLLAMTVRPDPSDRWDQGGQYAVSSRLFGVLPLGTQHIRFVRVDHDRMRAETEEHGGLVRSWRHVLFVVDEGDDTCTYTDHVQLDAGALTPLVHAFARLLYRHRHRRWRRLAPLLVRRPR